MAVCILETPEYLFIDLLYTLSSEKMTDQEASTLLYICSTGPFDSSLSRRKELMEDVWQNLNTLGMLDSHYVCFSLLSTFGKLINGQKIIVPEIIDDVFRLKSNITITQLSY